jgi:hypothetical protein
MSNKKNWFNVVKPALAATVAVFLAAGAVNADTSKDTDMFKIQTLVSELGGRFGAIDGEVGKMTVNAASEVLGFDASQMETQELLTALDTAHSKKFDVIANSGAPCKNYLDRGASNIYLPNGTATDGRIFAGEDENCRTIARLTTKSEFRGPIWDKPFFIEVDTSGGKPRLILWAAEMVAPYGEVIDTAGRAYLVNLPLNIEDIFSETTSSLLQNIERPLPFSIRRGQLTDIEGDGASELVLLASREDGRGPDNSNMSMGVPLNQTDVSFIYKLEDDTVVPFADRSFSHDLVVADLDMDGVQEIIDFGYNKKGNSRFGFQVCSGVELKCKWQFQDDIAVGRTSIAYDEASKSYVMFGSCGTRHTKGVETTNQLCWFDVNYDATAANPIKFKLLWKEDNQPPYDTKQEMMNWMKFVSPQVGWKIPDVDPSTSFIMGGMGFHSMLLDVDKDGDLDTINYNANRVCKKENSNLDYYEEIECDGVQSTSTIFLQNKGSFDKLENYSIDYKNFLIALHYKVVDFDGDGAPDIHNFARQPGRCIDTMATSLVNIGGGRFEFVGRDEVMGQYGCEVQSAFFTFEGEPYRVFLAKAKYEKQSFENAEVYVSIEYLGKNSSNMLSDSGVCDQAVRLVFSASGKQWKWSEETEAVSWVEEAKKRGLDCGISDATQSDGSVQADKEVVVAVEQPQAAKEEALSNVDLCNKAIRLVFSSTGKAWKWSEELDALNWVDEAKGRGLSCGVVP